MYRHRFTEFTDALTPVYDRLFGAFMGKAHEAFRGRILELAAVRPGERVLDAGCGTGLTALRIAARHPGCAVYGIDISPKMIAAARRNAEEKGLAADFRVGSITALPYPDASFDAVTTNIMFHHLDLEEKRRAVFEVARVLVPGGRYISAEFGPRATNALQRRMAKGDYTLYPSHLEEAGLIIMRYEIVPFALGRKVCYRVAVKPDRSADRRAVTCDGKTERQVFECKSDKKIIGRVSAASHPAADNGDQRVRARSNDGHGTAF